MTDVDLIFSQNELATGISARSIEDIISLAERLDFLDIQLLRKFYMTGKEHPFDCQPHCFPILYKEMKTSHKLKIGMEALRKRLNNLVVLGLLEKITHSNPTNYGPMRDKVPFVKGIISKFFVINGLIKFL
ncbi:MAG: hypothetical protein HYW24_01880 [Candidatus Aenigmarchaeota archaeon]|nr:hypothetical protein [Candidatus Aenigmarchaeota archaeon]